MLNEDIQLETSINALVSDENKQKDLLTQDEEEDFLDEGTKYSILQIYPDVINAFYS